MAPTIKTVALAGATGTLGPLMLTALLNRGLDVTVLSRKADAAVPASVTLKQVDYSDLAGLTTALQGIDAVVDTTGAIDAETPIRLIEAAEAAGVHRFVPSFFGSDPEPAELAQLPVFANKATVLQHLKKKATSDASHLTWTGVACGGFLDFCLGSGFLGVSLQRRRVRFFDDGRNPVPMTTLASTAEATATLLVEPHAFAETANRVVYVSNSQKSQVDMYRLAKDALGNDGWTEEEPLDMKKVYEDAMGELAKGNFSPPVFFNLIRYSSTLSVYGKSWAKNDNALLGVKQYSDDDVKQLVTDISKNTGYPDFF